MKRYSITIFSIFILFAFVLGACSTSTAEPPADEDVVATEVPQIEEEPVEDTGDSGSTEDSMNMVNLPEINPAAVEGDIISAGSSTVFPLAEAIAVRFEEEGYTGKITIDSIGSGAGYERFCVAGETDVANASRAIKDSEVESCQSIGREPIEFRVGTDAMAFVVSLENDFLQDLTIEQLAQVFSTAQTWSDIDPSFPAETILRYAPGTDSGTFDYFVEEVMGPAYGDDEDAGKEAILTADSINFSEDDNVLVQGVAGSPYAIGFFGFAYAQENDDIIRPISLEGVAISPDTAESGEYPMARPLFIYSDAGILQAKPQVADYINFFLTYVNDVILDVGYFPASVEAIDQARQAWLDALGQPAEDTGDSGSTEDSMNMVNLPEINPAAVEGDIISAGSSTVFPLAEAIAVRFEEEGYTGKITIDSIGSGAGYERFCVAGETDVANASRAIKDSEVESCQSIGREPIEFRVGTDAMAFVVSLENDFLQDLTLEQLAQVFSTAQTWSDIDPSFPAETILRYAPGTDSGTFDYFVEEVMGPAYGDNEDAGKEAILTADSINFSEDDNVLVQGVAGSPYAIGFFGFAYAQENDDIIRPISLEGVAISPDTAESGEYPMARPLFIYSDAGILQAKPQVADYINFFLTYVNDVILDVGYFPASVEAIDQARQAWLDALGQ